MTSNIQFPKEPLVLKQEDQQSHHIFSMRILAEEKYTLGGCSVERQGSPQIDYQKNHYGMSAAGYSHRRSGGGLV